MALNRLLYEEFDIPYEVSSDIWSICRKEKIQFVAKRKRMHEELLINTAGIYYGLDLNYKSISSRKSYDCANRHWYMGDRLECEEAVADDKMHRDFNTLVMMLETICDRKNKLPCSFLYGLTNITCHVSYMCCSSTKLDHLQFNWGYKAVNNYMQKVKNNI